MSTDNAGFSLLELDKLRELETIHSEMYGTNTDESDDEFLVSPSPQPANSDELNSIQQQLSKWLSNYEEKVTEDQFIQLLKKIAPFVSEKDVKELFHQFDFQDSGSVNKQVLIQNNYLAHLIVVSIVYLNPLYLSPLILKRLSVRMNECKILHFEML